MTASPSLRIATRRAASWEYIVWGTLIWSLGLIPVLGTLTSPRALTLNNLEVITSLHASQGGASRLLYFGSIGLVLGIAGLSLLLVSASRGARFPWAGLGLWVGAMTLASGTLISSFFGLRPNFSLALLSLPALFTTVYLLPPVPLAWFVLQAKRVLLLYAYGSLLAALIAPRWALESPYTGGLIPGLDVRLFGLGPHANVLAPFLLTYIIINWFDPGRTRWGRVHQAVVLSALILTQSKTIGILLILAYLVRFAYSAISLPPLQRYSVLALAGATLSTGLLYLAVGPSWLDSVGSAQSGEGILNLTGRTLIWQQTLSIWEQNPWFGYGPSLWNTEMSLRYAYATGWVFYHAHNQFYQSLGESGIVGAVGLVAYSTVLLVYGLRYARITNLVALALVLTLLLRGATEIPLHYVLDYSNLYLHFLTFAFIVLASRQNGTTNIK